MEDKKVKAGSVAVGICLFIIAVLLVAIVLVFYNSTTVKNNLQLEVDELKTSLEEKDKKVEELEDKISKVSDVIDEESKETELDKDSELVKELYNYVLKYDNSRGSYAWQNGKTASFYRDNKVIYTSLSDLEKTLTILKNVKDTKDITDSKERNEIVSLAKNVDKNIHIGNIKFYNNIDTSAKRIFGNSSQDKSYKSFIGCANSLEYINENYYEIEFEGGGLGNTEFAYSKIQKVEKNGEKINIYDKYIFLDFKNASLSLEDGLVNIYTSADKTKEIGKEEDTKIYNHELDKMDLESVYKKYEDKLNTYKHTFQKAEDGTYYWVSSEMYE